MSRLKSLLKRHALPGSCPSKRALLGYRQRSSPTSEGQHLYLAQAPSISHLPSTLGHQKRGSRPPESPHLGLNRNVLPFGSMDIPQYLSAPESNVPQTDDSVSGVIELYPHVGVYCHLSAHEKSGTSRVPHRLMKTRITNCLAVYVS